MFFSSFLFSCRAEESAEWLTEHEAWDQDRWDHTQNRSSSSDDDNHHQAKSIMRHDDGKKEKEKEDEEDASLFSRRFRASWVHARIVHYAVHLLEAKPLHEHGKAVAWLRKLLRSPHLPSARPRWWNRLSIDLVRQRSSLLVRLSHLF